MVVRWSICSAVLLLSVVSTIAKERTPGMRYFYRGRLHNGNVGRPPKSLTGQDKGTILEEYIDQQLDHFTPADNRTWKQRFFTNDHFFNKTSGPAFLLLGGESAIAKGWMTVGEWIENAEQFQALCFQLEHRYYGKSQPKPDLSMESLAYLNSEQALADTAFFIETMNERYNLTDRKWIVIGASYSGNLAAWMRLRYPHLAHAAVSSSSPLLAKLNFVEYYEVVSHALGNTSHACLHAVSDGFRQIGRLLQKNSGVSQISRDFRLCQPLGTNNQNDVDNFYDYLASNFAVVVQYNKDNRPSNMTLSTITIQDLCNIMTNESIRAPVERLAAVNSLILDATESSCLDFSYKDMIEYYRNDSLDAPASEGGRQWLWQTCVEFGYDQTSTRVSKIFGRDFPLGFFTQMCSDIFGPQFTETFQLKAVKRTNSIYGGRHLKANRVVYVHGSVDPWHPLGIIKTERPDAPAIYIEGTAHCADFYPSLDTDPPQLKRARETVRNYLRLWLS